MDVERLLVDLQSRDWEIAAAAAANLREVGGRQVTDALMAALVAEDTAIIDAAAESLILRNEPGTADGIWQVLCAAGDDVADQIWNVAEGLSDEPVSQELERRYRAQP